MSESTLRRIIRSGRLPAMRTETGTVRIHEDALNDYIRSWRPVASDETEHVA